MTKQEARFLLELPGEVSTKLIAQKLRYGPPGKPNLSDRVETIRLLHSARDGSYDADEVRQAIVEEIGRRSLPPHRMAYEDFLRSDYWYWLSDLMKLKADYTCQRCGVMPHPLGRSLNVHHKTYVHRGHEYPAHLDDLEVLCKACHQERHNPSPGANPDDIAW